MAIPVSVPLAKELVLSINDFVKHEPNWNNPLQFVWVFKTSDVQTYYIKFVFTENNYLSVFTLIIEGGGLYDLPKRIYDRIYHQWT
ncbi:hypothetical protein [Lactobacillus sp. PSON]|uniref:hypothetical protein n=1 Tax=Lactobacillus sp. PSON TaxID=3455454 RepID=UPI004042A675